MIRYRKKPMIVFLSITLVCLCIMLVICDDNVLDIMSTKTIVSTEVATSTVKNKQEEETKEEKQELQTEEEVINNTSDETEEVEEASEVIVEEPDPIVYDGMTLEELANKLERSMKNELSGYGYLYASYSLEHGVDPYLALAISLEETGCNWNCSNLVKSCNNVGGMKGSGCGAYGYFNNLEEGIKAFINNIERNYVAYGLTTAETMNPKYAENPAWANNVNNYINIIRNK